MGIAAQVAVRATCTRLKVGALIVKDNRIISSGYNGSIPGMPHCEDVGCDVEDGHCQATLHAEINALISAAQEGGKGTFGSTLYTTASPCWPCTKALVGAGVVNFYSGMTYRGAETLKRILPVVRSLGLLFVVEGQQI